MKIIIIFFSILIFIYTASYAHFERKSNNILASNIVYILAIISLIFPIIMIYIRQPM